jgi:hypothetical protein
MASAKVREKAVAKTTAGPGSISEWNDPKAVDRLVAKMKHPLQMAR